MDSRLTFSMHFQRSSVPQTLFCRKFPQRSNFVTGCICFKLEYWNEDDETKNGLFILLWRLWELLCWRFNVLFTHTMSTLRHLENTMCKTCAQISCGNWALKMFINKLKRKKSWMNRHRCFSFIPLMITKDDKDCR